MNNIKRLYKGSPATTVTTAYQVDSGTNTILKNILLCNTSSTSATITIHVVAVGETLGNSTKIISEFEVAAKDTVVVDLSMVLTGGDSVSILQNVAGSINAYLSGVEVR